VFIIYNNCVFNWIDFNTVYLNAKVIFFSLPHKGVLIFFYYLSSVKIIFVYYWIQI